MAEGRPRRRLYELTKQGAQVAAQTGGQGPVKSSGRSPRLRCRSPRDTGAHGRDWSARWVRFYTRSLPAPIARRRVEEINADLHDHIAHERTRGTSDRRIALSILSRMIRGIAADASWRGRHATTIGIVRTVAFVLLLPLLAMQITDEVVWGPFDFAVAGALLIGTGLAYRAATKECRRYCVQSRRRCCAGGSAPARLVSPCRWRHRDRGRPRRPDVRRGAGSRDHRRRRRTLSARGNGARVGRDGARPGAGGRDRAARRQAPVPDQLRSPRSSV